MKQLAFSIFSAFFLVAPIFAQSTSESFPTPIVQNEVSGRIAARDIGDARLTRYFYTFFADNGDVNLNIETANFDGDIDLFEAETLRPLAKITIIGDAQASKTNRIVYFRKREQIVLRIEGRSLADEAADYRIAFSGSFAAALDLPQPPTDVEPKVSEKLNAEVVGKVNSAGTIIQAPAPKNSAAEEAEATDAKPEPAKRTTRRSPRTPRTPVKASKPKSASAKTVEPSEKSSDQSVATAAEKTEENGADEKAKTSVAKKPKPVAINRNKAARVAAAKNTGKKAAKASEATAAAQPDPLVNVQLVILLKDGTRTERPMSEVFNVSVDKGQITVTTKNGKILRYNLLEVQKMVIE